MLKILQARLQQYVNRELPDVQAGFIYSNYVVTRAGDIHTIYLGYIFNYFRFFKENKCYAFN